MTSLRLPGEGCLVLIGGGEFSFGETEDADQAWLDRCADGPVGFVPAASGSNEYGRHFADYLREGFERVVETVPIYRARDARRGRNLERLEDAAAVYLGGGVGEHLVDILSDSPALELVHAKLRQPGGVVVAIAAAAQAAGRRMRSLFGGGAVDGFGWLPQAAVEANFDPERDRRLRRLLRQPGVRTGLGLGAGAALLLGPGPQLESVGDIWRLDHPEAALEPLAPTV